MALYDPYGRYVNFSGEKIKQGKRFWVDDGLGRDLFNGVDLAGWSGGPRSLSECPCADRSQFCRCVWNVQLPNQRSDLGLRGRRTTEHELVGARVWREGGRLVAEALTSASTAENSRPDVTDKIDHGRVLVHDIPGAPLGNCFGDLAGKIEKTEKDTITLISYLGGTKVLHTLQLSDRARIIVQDKEATVKELKPGMNACFLFFANTGKIELVKTFTEKLPPAIVPVPTTQRHALHGITPGG